MTGEFGPSNDVTSWRWEPIGWMAAWLARCEARPSFAVIKDNLDPKYLAILHDLSDEGREKVAALLDENPWSVAEVLYGHVAITPKSANTT